MRYKRQSIFTNLVDLVQYGLRYRLMCKPIKLRVQKIKKFEGSKKIGQKIKFKKFIDLINNSKKPLFIVGNGVKQSNTSKNFRYLSKRLKIPFLTSRFALDTVYSLKENMGLLELKDLYLVKN